jgi:hypothetical protein
VARPAMLATVLPGSSRRAPGRARRRPPITALAPAQRWRRVRLLSALTLAVALALAAAARADVGAKIIERCAHGQSLSGFSQQAYSRALRELPTEVEEYSDCANLIRRAQLAAAGGEPGTTPTATPLTPAERASLDHATRTAPAPLRVDGRLLRPGVVPVDISSALSSLPTPLLATLAFMTACLLLLVAGAIRDHVRARRSR